MKRAAESQLTKDSAENEDETSDVVASGIQKADSSVLEERIIRKLPRRSLAPTNAPTPSSTPPAATTNPSNETAEESPEPASRFRAFGGFGSGAATSGFSFSVPQSHPKSTPSQSSSAFPAPLPTTSSKPFSLFSGHSNPTPPNTPPLAQNAQKKQDAALKYYISLRGINSSFLDAATKAIHTDPFVDITELLERYKSLRLAAQQEFDSQSKALETSGGVKVAAQAVTREPSSAKASASTSTSGPTNYFSSLGTSSIESPKSSAGFTSKMDSPAGASVSPFVFSKTPASASTIGKPTFGGFSFGQTNSISTHTPFGSSSPLFGGLAPSTPDVKASPKNDTSNSFKPSTSAAPLTPGLSSFLSPSKPSGASGDTSTPVSTNIGTSSASPPSPSAFGFGSGKNPGVSSPFVSFGKGSIGNPVGFGFGSSPVMAAAQSSDAGTSGSKASTAASGAGKDTSQGDGLSSNPSNTEHDPSPAPSQGSAYDTDGPGEEDESTMHEIKARVFKMTPAGGWASAGGGQLKLKAHNELAKRRILMRNSSTGQVILNFNLLPAFKVTAKENTISFSVPEEDQSATIYRLRVPTETDALKWQEIIQEEVDRLVPSNVT